MKNLVLGVLLAAAASSAACTSPDSGVPVTWRFTKLANNTTLGCPSGFSTARVVSQAVDDTTHIGAGEQITDLFDCAAGHGSIALPNDAFLIWVEIESDSGTTLYAQSQETYYDTALDNFVVDAEIIDDGGFFFLEWDLFDSLSGRLMSCAEAGVTGGNSAIDVISTSVSGPTGAQDDRFDCTDHYGATDPLLAGSYQIQVSAIDSANQHAGTTTSIDNRTIRAPGGYTDLGLVHIPID